MALIKLLHDEIAPLVGVRLTTEEHLSRDGLSKRLRETLLLLLEGYSEKQVAGELMLAVRTVHELCCDALSALSCFGSRRTFGLLYPAEAGSTTTGADRFRNELAPTPTCSGDCHGDFKSVGELSFKTYVDWSTAEVVFLRFV